MSEQNGTQKTSLQRPSNRDKKTWEVYWEQQGQSWRTEPEIDEKRQKYLIERRNIEPDIDSGIYAFKDIEPKLTRADIEWLLATHENGRGPVDWSDQSQRSHQGIDLIGADLRGLDLHNLPLTCLRGSFKWKELPNLTEEQLNRISIQIEGADLTNVHLEGAILTVAHLEKVNLKRAHLEEAYLIRAHLERAILIDAHIERANLTGAYLEGAYLERVSLADQNRIGPRLLDTQWSNVNLAMADWSQVKILDDEYRANQINGPDAKPKSYKEKLRDYEKAVRANRQLAVALQAQGLNEVAARFSYRAQVLQKSALFFQMTQPGVMLKQRIQIFGAWLFSWFLFLLAGYGYRPGRSIMAYLVIIFGFMGLYLLTAHFSTPHLRWDEALVLSVSSFHGRGFFTQDITLGDTYARLAAIEAVVGLFIEISFIATFTQRFFGK
jgi:uncharacterized protein YjbI with pentapeptide repeats